MERPTRRSPYVTVVRISLRLLLAGLALLLALEITSRLSLFGLAGLDLRRVPISRGLSPPGLWSLTSVDGRFVPNLDVFQNLVRLRTNSEGFRDKEYALAKGPNTFRVAVMGSSFTMPAGVEIEDSFHSLLEERYSAEYAPTTFEFINFATMIMSPTGVLARLRRDALLYNPDLILVGVTQPVVPFYLLEGTGESEAAQWPPPSLVRAGAVEETIQLRSYFRIQLRRRLAPPRREPGRLRPPPTGPNPNDVVKLFGDVSRSTGIPIVMARLEYDANEMTSVERLLATRIVGERMYYVNTRQAFRDTRPRDFWVHALDPHPDARAHALFADVIDKFLRSRNLLGR